MFLGLLKFFKNSSYQKGAQTLTKVAPPSVYNKMDALNTKAMKVLETKSTQTFINHVFTNPEDREKPKSEQRQLSYAEMRMLYG